MGAIKTVADSQGWFVVLTTVPANLDAIKVSDLTGVGRINGGALAAANGTRFAFTASDSVADPAYSDASNAQTRGRSNYEGSIAPFVKVDEATGAYNSADNALITLLNGAIESGAEICVVSGITGDPNGTRAAGDMYDAFTYTVDNSSTPAEVGGYLKRTYPLLSAGKSAHMKPLAAGA